MGIPQSLISPVGALFSSLVNPILAIGLLRRSRWTRRFAIAWYAFLSLVAALVVSWLCYYHVSIDLASWPDQMISKVMPVFLFVVMLLPPIRRVFVARPFSGQACGQEGGFPPAGALAGWTKLSLSTLLFLIVACSNLIVGAADWGFRLIFDTEALP